MRTLFFFFTALLCLTATAQRVSDFNVYDGGNGSAVVRFVLTPGPACSGYEVMHSTDSLVYNSVHFYDQTCGETGVPDPREWTHMSPSLNTVNFYKIQLLSPYETSDVRRIYVSEPGRSRMIAYPNPVYAGTDLITVKAFNSGSAKLIGFIFNQFGTTMGEVEVHTTADVATLDITGLANGLHILTLTDGSNLYSCKFIVYR